MKEALIKKINDKTAKIAVIGLGYVGLPLAVEKAKTGYTVTGFDVNAEKVDMVNKGINYIGDVVDSDLKEIVEKGLLSATEDFDVVKQMDCVAICVPTPLDKYRQPDISYVESSAKEIAKRMHKGMLIVLESTTYPGTTEEVMKPILESTGFKCGEDFFLAFSPERIDPGNATFNTKNTPKVVGGITPACTEVAAKLYGNVLECEIFKASSPAIAEMEKILENTYRNINIALINEMAILCDKMDIDIWEVVDAASTKPYGFQAFYPGPGLGGHCIPIDPYYLSWKAREYDYSIRLIETSGEINESMPLFVVEKSSRILNTFKKSVNGSKVLILGVAYKSDIDDYRESPSLKIIQLLEEQGATVSVYDPFISEFKLDGKMRSGMDSLSEKDVKEADLVLLLTNHTTYDYEMIYKNAKVIFDTKNGFKALSEKDKIWLL
jgi:UDP-N-acetyl-D-glucosamine dehydrogenase